MEAKQYKAMTLNEVAEILSIDYTHAYNLVTFCKNCGKSITTRSEEKKCKCDVHEPILRSFNVGKKTMKEIRVEPLELEKLKKERMI